MGNQQNILAFVAMTIVVAGLLVMNIFIKERSFWPQVFQTEKEQEMKKIILLLLTLVACAAVSMAAADDLKDNSLQIDDSRLEKKEGLKFGLQSEQIKELFNESDSKEVARHAAASRGTVDHRKGPTVFCYTGAS